jgi:hypothetical protein
VATSNDLPSLGDTPDAGAVPSAESRVLGARQGEMMKIKSVRGPHNFIDSLPVLYIAAFLP